MKGTIIGSTQVKFLSRDRLFIESSVKIVTFSFAGRMAIQLRAHIRRLHLEALDWIVMYIGGNDIQNGTSARALLGEVSEAVEEAWRHAEHVFLFKLVPQTRRPELSHFIQDYSTKLHCISPVQAGDATVLNVDVLTRSKHVKDGMLGLDAYHISSRRGLSCLAGIVRGNLVKRSGPRLKGQSHELQLRPIEECHECGAKGRLIGMRRALRF